MREEEQGYCGIAEIASEFWQARLLGLFNS